MRLIDNGTGMSENMSNLPGLMQFAVFVDSYGQRYRLAEFMYLHNALAFGRVTALCQVYERVAVERIA